MQTGSRQAWLTKVSFVECNATLADRVHAASKLLFLRMQQAKQKLKWQQSSKAVHMQLQHQCHTLCKAKLTTSISAKHYLTVHQPDV